jgi:hypothetical protein
MQKEFVEHVGEPSVGTTKPARPSVISHAGEKSLNTDHPGAIPSRDDFAASGVTPASADVQGSPDLARATKFAKRQAEMAANSETEYVAPAPAFGMRRRTDPAFAEGAAMHDLRRRRRLQGGAL